MRTDPDWSQKVALNWSVVCVAPGHPRGDQDWDRLVRKHTGFYGVDVAGDIVDVVAHIDPRLSPYTPPPATAFDAVNTRMLTGSEGRPQLAGRWRVLDLIALVQIDRLYAVTGAERQRLCGRPPSIDEVASAVADALHDTGQSPVGAEDVRVRIDEQGEYRCLLTGVAPDVSERFAAALAEAVAPITAPRYLLPRWTLNPSRPGPRGWPLLIRDGIGPLRADGEVWHAVPTVLGDHAQRARAYAQCWNRWIGGGEPVFTQNPDGAGILAATRGSDPFDATAEMRTGWR